MALNFEKRAIKQQGYIEGFVNDVGIKMLIDTGAEITLIAKEMFDQIADKPLLLKCNCQLYAANGTPLTVLGQAAFNIKLNDHSFVHTVMVIDGFSYEFLLGKDFLIKNKAAVDFGNFALKFPGFDVNFTRPKREQTLSTVADVHILPQTTIAMQTKFAEKELIFSNDLLIEGGFSRDNALFVARILTKARPTGKVTVQVTNLTENTVFLPKNTELADVMPFIEQQVANAHGVKVDKSTEPSNSDLLSDEDLGLDHLEPNQKVQLLELLNEMNITKNPKLGKVDEIKHRIDVGDSKPIKQHPYRVPMAKREIIDEEVEKMLVKEVISPSVSPWSSPIVLVAKPDGSTRFCIDYREVNNVTKKDAYPLPRVDDTLDALGGAKYFTTLDLQSGYWQVTLEENSKEITAFSTSKGHWEFNVMPFGLTNAPATFQRLMDYVLTGLHWSQCLVYLDDVIIFGRNFDEHLTRLRTVLARLNGAGLSLKPSKCQWAKTEVKYLGHIIDGAGIKPDPSKLIAVRDFPIPENRTEVRAFLGLASYYRRFIPSFATIAKPLTNLTKTKEGKAFQWTSEEKTSFEHLKELLMQSPILCCPDFNKPFILQTDASNHGLGAVLTQEQDGAEVAVAYASRQLKPSEENYATIQKECLAIVWAIKYFHHYLFGQSHFTVITDHCPLQWIKTMKTKNQMIQRWICEIQGYSFSVKHRAGTTNGNADALSRCPISSELSESENCENRWDIAMLELVDISSLQDRDKEIKAIKDFLSDGILPEDLSQRVQIEKYAPQYLLEGDVLYHTWTPGHQGYPTRTRKQLVVPPKERGKLLYHQHEERGHSGFLRTFSRLREDYFWISMKKDVARHVKNCKDCAKRKSPKKTRTVPLRPIIASEPLEIVGIDFVGPLPLTVGGNRYVMTFQDHFTRWPAAYALPQAKEEEVIQCIQAFSRDFGYPKSVLSDRGSAFLSDLVKKACKKLKIGHSPTSAYHPQANGLCERFHSTLKTSLSLVIDKGKDDWDDFLHDMVAAYRTTPHTVTKESPAFLMFGRQFRVPPSVEFQAPARLYSEDFLSERMNNLRQAYRIVRNLNQKEKNRHKVIYDEKHKAEPSRFTVGDSVYLKAGERKSGLDREHWMGPYIVEDVVSEENVKLKMGDSRRHPVVNVNRLKMDKADDLKRISESVTRILDKMRTRNEKGRLESKYFVELKNGETLWIADDYITPELINASDN